MSSPWYPADRQIPDVGRIASGAVTLGRPIGLTVTAFLGMVGAYFGILTLASGWRFTVEQFSEFWTYVVALGTGFGVQVGLFAYLRQLVRGRNAGGGVVAATGSTSAAAMISCCTHYLANVLPVLGASGLVALVAQYQIHLFWVGIVLNAAGLIYICRKVQVAGRYR